MTEYKDMKSNTYEVKQKSTLTDEERQKIEEDIVEELYKIFAK